MMAKKTKKKSNKILICIEQELSVETLAMQINHHVEYDDNITIPALILKLAWYLDGETTENLLKSIVKQGGDLNGRFLTAEDIEKLELKAAKAAVAAYKKDRFAGTSKAD